jgi:hypothetical protein
MAANKPQHLKTEVVTAVDCKRPTVAGDKIHVHCTFSHDHKALLCPLPPQYPPAALLAI